MSENKNILPKDLIYSDEVVEFVTIANEFCKLLEGLNIITREQFIKNTYKILVILQLKSIILPKPKDENIAQTESFVNEADWHFIDNEVSSKLGNYEIISDLREPANPEISIEISISECMADTYQDLKDFTQLYQYGNPEAVTQGLWECKTNFEQVWGPRIMIVIKEFHNLIHGENDLSEEEKNTPESNPKGENWIDDLFEN